MKIRKRTIRRWATPGFALLALFASLVFVVRRGEVGYALDTGLRELETESRIVADRIDAEQARVDSLTTRGRIGEAAGALGLRQAAEGELIQVAAESREDDAGVPGVVGAPARSAPETEGDM